MKNSSMFIGLMSGTSIDAIDAALVEFTDTDDITILATHRHPWPGALQEALLHLSQHPRKPTTLHEIASLDVQVGELFAQATLALLATTHVLPRQIRAIGSPGQTIDHAPTGQPPYTWQLGDPNLIAHQTQIPTVADFRRRDVAAGGQGAPLTPAFHQAWWRSPLENRVVLNIGGIANLTVLPAQADLPVIGFDTGPGNALLDAYSLQQQHLPFDAGGRWAARGQVQPSLLEAFLADPYFARPAPKSTGRDYFNLAWLTQHPSPFPSADVQATLAQLTIDTIVQAVSSYAPQRLLVCGGGSHNQLLISGISQKLPNCSVESTLAYGIDPDWVEAVSFAWLAKQRLAEQPGNLPSVTGARQAVVLGSIYL